MVWAFRSRACSASEETRTATGRASRTGHGGPSEKFRKQEKFQREVGEDLGEEQDGGGDLEVGEKLGFAGGVLELFLDRRSVV